LREEKLASPRGISFSISASLKQFKNSISELPDIVQKQGQEAAQLLSTSFKKAEEDIGKSLKRAGRNIDKNLGGKKPKIDLKDASEGIKKFGELAEGSIGSGTTKIFDFGESLSLLAKGAGPMGLAIAGVAALTATTAGLTYGVIQAIAVTEEWNKELKKLESSGAVEPLDAKALQSVEKFNDALDGIKIAFKAIVVEIGGAFAPELESLAVQTLALSLQFKDWFAQILEGGNVFKRLGQAIVSQLIQTALRPLGGWILELGKEIGWLARALGFEGLGKALEDIEESYNNFTKGVAGAGLDLATSGLSGALDGAASSTENYQAKAERLISSLRKQKGATNSLRISLEELDEKYQAIFFSLTDDALSEEDKILRQFEEFFDQITEYGNQAQRAFEQNVINSDQYEEMIQIRNLLLIEAEKRRARDEAELGEQRLSEEQAIQEAILQATVDRINKIKEISKELETISKGAREPFLTEEEKILGKYEEQNKKIDEQVKKLMVLAATGADVQSELTQAAATRYALEIAQEKELDELRTENAEKQRQQMMQNLEVASNVAQSMTQFIADMQTRFFQEQMTQISELESQMSAAEDMLTERQQKELEIRRRQNKENEQAMTVDKILQMEKELAEKKEQAQKLFRVQKALAIAQIAIDAAVAQIAIWKGNEPIAVKTAASIGVGLASLGALAGVASQEPPQFLGGGVVDQLTVGQNNQGQIPAVLHPREKILNPVGAQTMSNEELKMRNRGQYPMQNQVMQIALDGRVLDVQRAKTPDKTYRGMKRRYRRARRVGHSRRA
jgi:hypothetical protein